ncbi:MAG: hypothetical protein H6828_02340 [Planctomycetes bacterium]|nr:hypothetical protein [Planctomycetota bacterium]
MVFLHPGYLLLLLALPALAFFPRGPRDGRLVALRALVLGLLVLALARPVRVAADEPPVRVVVLDRSTSAAGGVSTETLRALAQRHGADGPVHLVAFGSEPDLDEPPRAPSRR